jgi:hypothetical protein
MKKKFKPWKKLLDASDLKHLKGINCNTKKAFSAMNDMHNIERQEDEALEPCYWCKAIAIKLDLEVKTITKPYGSKNLNTFEIDDEKGGTMKPVITIKSNIIRRLILCVVFPPCVVIALVGDAVTSMYKEFNKEMLDTFKHTWKGRE